MNNQESPISNAESLLMQQLREILLKEDRAALSEIQQILNERDLLAGRVNPIIEEHLEFLRKNFPKEYAKIVNRLIDQKLKDSQQQILDVVYPVLGKMINKYISLQIQQLKDSIDERINAVFSRQGAMWWVRNRIMGIKNADALLAAVDMPVLEEIFVIQRDSGLLLGNAALNPSINRDVVAGMMTAIKSFVEDAFERINEDLEMIQYGTYRIVIQNFPTFYIALALSGSVSTTEAENFRNQVLDFIQNTEGVHVTDVTSDVQERISQLLENEFIIPQKEKLQTLRLKKG